MYKWAEDLFPIYRCLTGKGVRETLQYISKIVPELQIEEIKSGQKAFDWVIPEEWEIIEAYIENEQGKKILDIQNSNLHIWGYSVSVDEYLSLEELKCKIITREDLPNAIPYVTTYYEKKWGFCMSHNQFKSLTDEKYHVLINSKHFQGVLNYGEVLIEGKCNTEVLLSTYICHPSMANNELSGPVVTMSLINWLKKEKREYTYRILFLPETIGPIAYLSINDNLKKLKNNVFAAFQITCCGDDNSVSFLPSKYGDTYVDKIVNYVLNNYVKSFTKYSYLDRGSDERQWSSPGINLPIISLMRSKYHEYKEYHTSLDDLSYISPKGLQGGFENIKISIDIIEKNAKYINFILCEPQMGKRNLYPNTSHRNDKVIDKKNLMNLLAYIDGNNDLIDLAYLINLDFFEVYKLIKILEKEKIISKI